MPDGVDKKEKSNSAEKPASEAKLKEVAFENLANYINDEKRHRAGKRFVVRDVPVAKIESVSNAVVANGNPAHRGLFALDFDEGLGRERQIKLESRRRQTGEGEFLN